MARKKHGETASGVPITDELISELADKAEAGYNVDKTAPSWSAADRLGARERRVRPVGARAAGGASQASEPRQRDNLVGDPKGTA